MSQKFKIFFVHILIAVGIHFSFQCPNEDTAAKAAYKSGEMMDQHEPVTLDRIKQKLAESGIFNWSDPTLTPGDRKELNRLFDSVEIMMTSRNRQPSAVQNVFYSLRVVERALKKQIKEGRISETLAAKFDWDKFSTRNRRAPAYILDEKTNMRIFNVNS